MLLEWRWFAGPIANAMDGPVVWHTTDANTSDYQERTSPKRFADGRVGRMLGQTLPRWVSSRLKKKDRENDGLNDLHLDRKIANCVSQYYL